MQLTAQTRNVEKKSHIKLMRREGNIPAVLYSPGVAAQMISVNTEEFEAALRKIKPGMLSTTVFTLNVDKKTIKAIVKDIQYTLTTYKVIHLDFEELKDSVPIRVNVPVNCVGVADCAGIKLGGFFNQVTRSIKVKCLPNDLPEQFEVDVRSLGLGQSKRLRDLEKPKGVTTLTEDEKVIVVIAKRT